MPCFSTSNSSFKCKIQALINQQTLNRINNKSNHMETTLSLTFDPLPCFPLHPKISQPKPTNLHLNAKHSSQFLSACPFNRHRFKHRVFSSPVPKSAPDESGSEDQKHGAYRVVKGAIGAVLAYVIFACCCGMKYKAIAAGPRVMYQKKAPKVTETPPSFHKMALNSLLEVTVNLASTNLDPTGGILDQLPSNPSKQDVDAIKMEAVKMIKRGKADEAVEYLQKAYMRYRRNPEPAYNVDMALVEILISQGKFKEALERRCLHEEQSPFSDHRQPLYKAIIFTMLDRNKEAKKYWQEFVDSITDMYPF